MLLIVLICVFWALMSVFTYKSLMSDWKQTTFEKIWLSLVWPIVWLFKGIHVLYNKNNND